MIDAKQADMVLDLRKGCVKTREGRREMLSLIATGLASELAASDPAFDREAFMREALGHA